MKKGQSRWDYEFLCGGWFRITWLSLAASAYTAVVLKLVPRDVRKLHGDCVYRARYRRIDGEWRQVQTWECE